jgi:hypothetical protein
VFDPDCDDYPDLDTPVQLNLFDEEPATGPAYTPPRGTAISGEIVNRILRETYLPAIAELLNRPSPLLALLKKR